ncbi:MAG: putative transporter transrane protein [Ilumatobacteraceae bacterium]|nr:putative transporter transrane protein [Ilumatobacteraceae bacterium]MCU1388734.1 putative transporter transrane protein [Ilumatobacteraceae bacterium]
MSGTDTMTPAATAPEPEHFPTTHDKPTQSTLRAALVSEWTKLRSVRSTVWSLVMTSAFTIGLGTLFCWAYLHRREQRGDRQNAVRALLFDPTARSLNGVVLAQLAIGVLGVLVMSSEYTTGMIRTSLAAVPNRRVFLLAKTIVLAAVGLVVAMVSVFVAFFMGQAVLSGDGLGTSLSADSVLRAVLGAGLYLTLIALFGLAIGTIVRRTPGAIATLFGIVLILPLIAQAFPEPWDVRIGRLAPFNAGQAMFSVRYDPDLLTPTQGLFVFLGWIVLAYIIAMVTLSRRDA